MKRYSLVYRFTIVTFVALLALLYSSTTESEVYINNLPQDITINEGDPLDVPLFFAGGPFTGNPVELFVWVETLGENPSKAYLGPEGWVGFSDYTELRAAATANAMIEYLYTVWQALSSTDGLPSLRLNICLDGNVDDELLNGVNTDGAHCDTKLVNVIPKAPTPCTGLYVYNSAGNAVSSISKTVEAGGSASEQLFVKDSCDTPIDFTATKSKSWLSLTQNTGELKVTMSSTSLTAGTYNDTINISGGGASKSIGVTFKVNAGSCPFPPLCGGPGGGCTATTVSPWPASVTFTAQAGETKTQSIAVNNNCGDAVNYTANKTSGGTWLSSSTSGYGSLTVTADSSGLTAGTYNGAIQVSSSGLSSATVSVTLNVSGPCVPNSTPVVTPSSVNQSATVGTQPADVTVTIRSNCGDNLDYSVSAITDPDSIIASPRVGSQGTGSLTVQFNTMQTEGTYSGTITIAPTDTFYSPVNINVSLNVTTAPPPGGGDNATLLSNGVVYHIQIPVGDNKLYKAYANGSTPKNWPVDINLEDRYQKDGFGNYDVIIKYAGTSCENGPPNMNDYNLVKSFIASGNSSCPIYDHNKNTWSPRARDDLYYCISGDSFEFVEIYGYPDNPHGCYYMLVVNAGALSDQANFSFTDMDGL